MDELKNLFEGVSSELLTEDVKKKLTILIEAKVSERIEDETEKLEEKFEDFKEQELNAQGWDTDHHTAGCVIELENGATIYASSDDEGNSPGTLFGVNEKGEQLYIYPEEKMTEQKKYFKVVILNDLNEWVATYSDMTLEEAIKEYKEEKHKAEYAYDEDREYYAFGVENQEYC